MSLLPSPPEDKIVIYTDATWSKNKVSFIGFCSEDMFLSKVEKIKASDCNIAELEAVKMCLKYLDAKAITSEVEILTDSQYVIDLNLEIPANILLVKIPRNINVANTLVSIEKENNHVRKQ